jgi:hypothetical protein
MEALQVRRVSASDELVQPADFVLVKKREPVSRLNAIPFAARWWVPEGKRLVNSYSHWRLV